VQPLENGDPGLFIEKHLANGQRGFVHFPHKQAIKVLFPTSSLPRRQTWHSKQRRRGKGRSGGGGGS
jgi:hypothetical protein